MTTRDEQNAARTEADLIKLARQRGYKNPEWWAKRVLEGRARKTSLQTELTYGGKRV